MMKSLCVSKIIRSVLVASLLVLTSGETGLGGNFSHETGTSRPTRSKSSTVRGSITTLEESRRDTGKYLPGSSKDSVRRSGIGAKCLDCVKGKNKHSSSQTGNERPEKHAKTSISKSKARIRLAGKVQENTHQVALRPNAQVAAPRRFKKILEREVRRLERQWTTLTKRLLSSQNESERHKNHKKLKDDKIGHGLHSTRKHSTTSKQSANRSYISKEGGLILNSLIRQYGDPQSSKLLKSRKRKKYGRDSDSTDHKSWAADDPQTYNWNKPVRPELADILEKGSSSTSFLGSVHELRRHSNAMWEAFIASELELDHHYAVIFNGTRHKMMRGARDAIEVIHDANDYIVESMANTYHTTRLQMINYHMRRESQRRGIRLDEPQNTDVRENNALKMVKEMELRDFRRYVDRAFSKQNDVETFAKSVHALESECLRGEAGVERVRKLLEAGNYRSKVIDVRDYLRGAIFTINTGFLDTRKMRELRRHVRYMERVRKPLREGGDYVRKSYQALGSSRLNQKKNQKMVQEWLERRRRDRVRRNGLSRRRRSTLGHASDSSTRDLVLKVSACKNHSDYLKITADRYWRLLASPIQDAKRFLSNRTGSDVTYAQIKPLTDSLNEFTPTMYATLDAIRIDIGSQAEIRMPKRCARSRTHEGSGAGERDTKVSDENNLECDENIDFGATSGDGEIIDDVEEDKKVDGTKKVHDDESEGGGYFGNIASWWSSSDSKTNNDDDDFIFVDEVEVDISENVERSNRIASNSHQRQQVKQFNQDLKRYTTEMLRFGGELVERSRDVNNTQEALQQNWKGIKNQVNDMERTIKAQKNFKMKMDDKARDFLAIRSKLLNNIYTMKEPSMIKLRNAVKVAKNVERKTQASTMGSKPDTVPSDMEWYYYDDYYYGDDYDEEDVDKMKLADEAPQKDHKNVDSDELYKKGRQIKSNSNDIQRLRTLAVATCSRVGRQLSSLQRNVSTLRHKVHQARDMLNALQLSISKSGQGHIAVSVPSVQQPKNSDFNTVRVCIKPASLDGPVLVVKGNESVSYSVTLNAGEITLTAYDASWANLGDLTLDQTLKTDVWYTVLIQRIGRYLNASVQEQGQEKEIKSKQIGALESVEAKPMVAYVGGTPDDLYTITGSWVGCVGEFSVDGHSLSLYKPDSEGTGPVLCNTHCSSKKERLSTIFDGDGFVHYPPHSSEEITSLSFSFTTHQKATSLMSVVNEEQRIYLRVMLDGGVLRLESSTPRESIVYASFNKTFGDGSTHLVKIEYRGSIAYPVVDGANDVFQVVSNRPITHTDSMQGILIGAFISDQRQFYGKDYRPLIGCVGDVVVNGQRMLPSQAEEIYNAYQGHCSDAQFNVWHSCRHWSTESTSLLMGNSIPHSNTVSLWVSPNATGPVIRYVRKDDFTLDIRIRPEGLGITFGDSTDILSRPDEDRDESFFSITVVDVPDSKNVEVLAWEQKNEYSYGYSGWFFSGADSSKPHSLEIAGLVSDDSQKFEGYISRLVVGSRLVELGQYEISHKLTSCPRAMTDIPPRTAVEVLPPISCL